MGAIASAAVMIAGVMVAGSAMSKVFGSVMQKIGAEVTEEVSKNMAIQVQKEVAKDITQSVVSGVVKEVAEEVSAQTARKVLQTNMQKLMNSTLGQAFKRISQGLGRTFGTDEIKMAQASTRMQMASTAASMGNTTIQTVGSVITADMMVEAAKSKAHMMNDAVMQNLLNDIMSRAIETFTHRMETVNSMIKSMSAVAENQAQAGKYITRQMSSVAG